ncbi:hypothetical protein CDD81_904 [Ophiocordyceps australis]|uniref:Endosomal peripheral membrane protein n=1 Tax=Ophiocordyceps australis TaxID=1399860 RepID=A0A2C5YE29_9HYPO|nr:hypothetical protein CDD81_904 [Ophiocordyceps australis]
MTSQLLATELANLVQESKRKHNDLRQAAEKSLEELKQLGVVSEQDIGEQLSQRSSFVNPLIVACGTKNAKFTGIAIVCLQRLIIARALPPSKLDQVLEALMQASSAGLDVQLKILQALPSLLQNYSVELKGDLLVAALNICFVLQSSKNAIVNNTSAATLQQLVVSVFDKVVADDENESEVPKAGQAPSGDGKMLGLGASALDAYRIFNDLCLMTESQRPEFLRASGLQLTFGLELIESVITNHAAIFTTHPEQAQILRARVVPLISSTLKGKPSFATTVRLVRIMYTLLRRHMDILPSECGDMLEMLMQLLDQEAALWKRALCMEVFRGIFLEHALVRRIFAQYDSRKGERDILKTLTATFVRLSTEKPSVIGLGPHSTMPVPDSSSASGIPSDQAMLEASGMTGIIGGGSMGSEVAHTGISTYWSSMRVPCIDQLDKTEPPSIPESYLYSLVLACISSLSDGLAKFVLPLTVPSEARNRPKASRRESTAAANSGRDSPAPTPSVDRASSFKKNPVPGNPLELEDHPLFADIKICASIVQECWPAILATCSTFLYAALDQDYYHGLVRAFQRFAHVAGLLHLSTPRDAFLTTLGKSAVPPNVLTASHSSGQFKAAPSPQADTPTNNLFSNARGLLSVESLTPASPSADKQRHPSFDVGAAMLNTRNLLCLRALLNLGIALGPTLGSAWTIILETLQQADFVLFTTGKAPGRTPSLGRGQEPSSDSETGSLMSNFGNEVRSVETAALRLVESSIDFPNAAFVQVVEAMCGLLDRPCPDKSEASGTTALLSPVSETAPTDKSRRPSGAQHRRVLSFSSQSAASSTQEFMFALAKLGELASVNTERLLASDAQASGWTKITGELTSTLGSSSMAPLVRVKAAETLSRLMLKTASAATVLEEDVRAPIQLRILGALRDALDYVKKHGGRVSVANNAAENDVHRIMLEGLKSIIEECGQSLIGGWDIAFEVIGSVFESASWAAEKNGIPNANRGLLATRSSKLVRSSFSSLQLICSDFLDSLPNSCFLILVDTLYKFCSQDDDLNIALTTVTFFWVLSDFLSSRKEPLAITRDVMKDGDGSALEALASNRELKGSGAALWMLLLLRLTAVTTDERLELRNSAIQTLIRIFDAYGDVLSPEAWSVCVECVIFRLLSSLESELKASEDQGTDDGERPEWHGTAVVVLDGISRLLANYLHVFATHASFDGLWRAFIEHLATLVDFEVVDINTATFKALSRVLQSQSDDSRKVALKQTSISMIWELWSRGVPTAKDKSSSQDNEASLIAYVSALSDVYKLDEQHVGAEKVERMLTLLREAVESASTMPGSSLVSDMEKATPLQSKTLEAMQMIGTEVDGVPSAMVKQVSRFVTLAYEQQRSDGARRSYVAMSKASMTMLQNLIHKHASAVDMYTSGAMETALGALVRPIALKYQFHLVTKSTQPWRLATSCALEVVAVALPRLRTLDLARQTVESIWAVVVSLANGILSADTEKTVADADIATDQEMDIECFHKLRALMIPGLGGSCISDKVRRAYAQGLFETSIIHAVSMDERGLIDSKALQGGVADVASLYKVRAGRTMSVLPTKRTRMAYVAFEELFALVSGQHVASDDEGEATRKLWCRIATATAPHWLLRCGLTLRGYAADQPLRGMMPQPLSQRKEVLWTLQKMIELESESEAMATPENGLGRKKRHLLKLYPLLMSALKVGRDVEVSGLLEEALEMIGGELSLG